jgi:solute carrier family 29 (equilibrative nucleoside transporter), member 1/2/3
MDKVKDFFWPQKASYEPVDEQDGHNEDQDPLMGSVVEGSIASHGPIVPFYWSHYAVFTLLGIAMLWAWYVMLRRGRTGALISPRNMFLAAGPYFLSRLQADKKLQAQFQPSELAFSTTSNMLTMIILTNAQKNASYTRRIITGLILNIVVFTTLTISTKVWLDMSPVAYFSVVMIQIWFSSMGTGFMQNGIFAYMAGFGREEYAQGNMTGQAIAGVLPCIVQIVSVLSVSSGSTEVEPTSALAYFATAVGISFATLLAFLWLLSQQRRNAAYSSLEQSTIEAIPKKRVPLVRLFRKTFYLATSVFLTFAITMVYPVFTLQIQSVRSPVSSPPLFRPAAFVPLAFLIWNSGDLVGRLLAAIPSLRITHKPRTLLAFAISRVLFVPLYYLCNINGTGAVVKSDFFYLVIVQLLFGVTNGFIGTMGMMGAVEYVDVEEREAAGAFMTLMLVAGLTAGSLLSFLVA